MTYEEVNANKYRVENQVLKDWSLKYGIVDCMTTVRRCLANGSGHMGGTKIDREFVAGLSLSDRILYNGVIAWYDAKNL